MISKESLIKKVLELNKIQKLNPIQKEAIEKGVLDGENLILATPTSSGKTLVAEIAGLNVTLNYGKKMIYLCPLVALAREKYEEFKEKYETNFKIKVALSIGNLDSYDPFLEKYSWIIASNEKADSLIRHGAPWFEDVGLIVADEIHFLNDFERGPTLEILLTILKEKFPKTQILALSATIANPEDLAIWLGAKVIKSNFRPVPLYFGIQRSGKIKMFGREDYILKEGLLPEEAILTNTLLLKKQIIYFLSTRRSAEALAEKLTKRAYLFLSKKEQKELEDLSQKIKSALEVPTRQCEKLAEVIKGGVAFYHSGLLFEQRKLIEEAYKKGLIKAITSTTALGAGVNLPNFRSVVCNVKRYVPGLGSVFLPVLEVWQMFGRSGRVKFDKWGEGILIAKDKEEELELEEIYLKGEIEEISSKLNSESALRMHLLSLISQGICKSESALKEFLSKTFFGIKVKNFSELEEKIEEILFYLESWGFIYTKEIKDKTYGFDKKLKATRAGKRVSELYLDPLTAKFLIESLSKAHKFNDFSLILIFARSNELKPALNLTKKDFPIIEEVLAKNEKYLSFEIPDEFDENYEEFLREVKLALVFLSWIEEKTEEEIFEKFKITPGELRSRIEILDWLLYSAIEIGKIVTFKKEILKKLQNLRVRNYYGVREELLPLVKLRGIGRVRGRILFDHGIKNLKDLENVSQETLTRILKSSVLAKKVKEEIKNLKL